jgi:hypothetical protein
MYPTENLTTRVYAIYADIVRRAAEKAGKSISEYVGDIVVPWAASDLGERLPPLPPLERGRYRTLVEAAAARAGMTRRQWERHAIETQNALALGIPTPDEVRAPRPPSGERKTARIGGYAVARPQEEELAPRRARAK